MIKLIISNAGMEKLKTLGVRVSQARSLRWTTEHPQSHYRSGVLLYAHAGDILDGAGFRALRDNFGAVIVTDFPLKKITGALGVPAGESGILQGLTEEAYAHKLGISRQEVNRKIHTGKIPTAEMIGNVWIIKDIGKIL